MKNLNKIDYFNGDIDLYHINIKHLIVIYYKLTKKEIVISRKNLIDIINLSSHIPSGNTIRIDEELSTTFLGNMLVLNDLRNGEYITITIKILKEISAIMEVIETNENE